MKLQYHLTATDLETCQAHVAAQWLGRRPERMRRMWWRLPPVVLLVLALLWVAERTAPYLESWRHWIMWGTLVLFYGSWLATLWWRRGGRWKAWLAQFAGDHELTLSPGGAWFRAHGRCGFYSWQHVLALEETEHYWLLYLRSNVAAPIPKSALPEEAAAGFVAEVRRLWAEHSENRGQELPALPSEPAIGEHLRRALGDNLLAGLRLACWRPVNLADFRAGTRPLVWLVLLELAVSALASYLQSLSRPVFNFYGVSGFGAEVLLFLLGGVAVATMVVSRESIPRLWVMLLAGLLVVEIPYLVAAVGLQRSGIDYPGWLPWGMYLAYLGWSLLVVFRAMRLLYLQPAPTAWLLVSVFAFFNFAMPGYLPQHQMFYPDYGDEEAERNMPRIDAEATFYRQPQLVSRALSGLRAQRPGKTDLYFVGFAGQADEKVFTNEVRYARGLLERRFGAAGRSLALLNSADAVADTPLANAHNLELVLQGVAERMDKDEDVLFLFLTSHGAQDHSLSVSFWPLELNDLKAERLKEMLDSSGIRNRVIVVSACYSGGFLDVLKDDNTLVLTASSRDHVSYGCGDATEYTYFGESYFVKALARENSFVTAFDQARGLIEAREKSEGKDASGPQIYVGKNIRRKLDALEVRKE